MPAPFPSNPPISVVLPRSDGNDRLGSELPRLLAAARPGLRRELGADIRLVDTDPGRGSRWLVGPASLNPAVAAVDHPRGNGPYLWRKGTLLITSGPDLPAVIETFGLLRSLHRLPEGLTEVHDCADIAAAIAVVRDEVKDSWPSFRRRNLDWGAICRRHIPRVEASGDPILALRTWLAELGDAHTWVRNTQKTGRLPYEVEASQRDAVLVKVPEGSAGYQAGARPGHRMVGVDPGPVWRATAASVHQRGLLAGRHLLTGAIGIERVIEVRAPGGRRIAWREAPADPYEGTLVHWERRASGAGYLRIVAWLPGIEQPLAEAFDALRGCRGLIVDLRGNGGGNVFLAHAFRDRFIGRERPVGTIRYSIPGGGLTDGDKLMARPSDDPADRWKGPVRFLTDALTYSASEDALLGLQGAAHVQVYGMPSGGGSGRARHLRLLPGYRLSISTALTYDMRRNCIEGSGIPVDRRIRSVRPTEVDEVLAAADRGW